MVKFNKTSIKEICKNISSRVKGKSVLLLIGGESSESKGSIKESDEIIDVLKKHAKTVIVSNPKFHQQMLTKIKQADLVFNGMYGGYGEDGRIQGLLDILKKPFTGSHTLASAIGMNKYVFRQLLKSWGFPVPEGQRVDNWIKNPNASLQDKPYYLLKPVDEGDSYGIKFCKSLIALEDEILKINPQNRHMWIVEEYVKGRPGTMALIGFKDEIIVGKPMILSLPSSEKIYTTALKYFGDEELKYDFLEGAVIKRITKQTQSMFTLLDCKGAIRFDFIYTGDNIKYIELNTLPGLYTGSNLHMAFKHLMSFEELVLLCLSSALFFERKESIGYEYLRKSTK